MLSKTTSKIVSVAIAAVLFAGCAGRAGNPVPIHIPGDDTRSCESIAGEMYEIEKNIHRLIPQSSKVGKNVALGVGGALLFPPALFFMDLKNGEKVELEAFKRRYEYLAKLAKEKHCVNCPTVGAIDTIG